MKGGARVVIEPHRHPGVFIARGKEDALCTLNLNPGKQVYGEKLVKVDVSTAQHTPVGPHASSFPCFLPPRHWMSRALMVQRSSTASGILSARSSLPPSWAALKTFTWDLAAK